MGTPLADSLMNRFPFLVLPGTLNWRQLWLLCGLSRSVCI